MKLWEVMRLLEENPAKVYEARLVRNPWVARVLVEKGCYKFTGHDGNDGDQIIQPLVEERMTLDLDWYEVKQPVPWQEAIKEFAKGKKLVVSFNNKELTLGELVELPKYLDGAITSGKWYVEERE
jgi:hypothetical protein